VARASCLPCRGHPARASRSLRALAGREQARRARTSKMSLRAKRGNLKRARRGTRLFTSPAMSWKMMIGIISAWPRSSARTFSAGRPAALTTLDLADTLANLGLLFRTQPVASGSFQAQNQIVGQARPLSSRESIASLRISSMVFMLLSYARSQFASRSPLVGKRDCGPDYRLLTRVMRCFAHGSLHSLGVALQ